MVQIEMLQKMMVAQVQAQLALGAAVEELALWVEANGGRQAALNARDSLRVLDESSAMIGECLAGVVKTT